MVGDNRLLDTHGGDIIIVIIAAIVGYPSRKIGDRVKVGDILLDLVDMGRVSALYKLKGGLEYMVEVDCSSNVKFVPQ